MGIRAGLGPRLGGGIREQSEIGLGASVVGVGWGREARRKGLDWVGKKGEERRRRNSRREGEREQGGRRTRERERERNFFSFLVVANLVWVPPSSSAEPILGVRIFGSSDTYSYVLS